jgi:hypothetical protein
MRRDRVQHAVAAHAHGPPPRNTRAPAVSEKKSLVPNSSLAATSPRSFAALWYCTSTNGRRLNGSCVAVKP